MDPPPIHKHPLSHPPPPGTDVRTRYPPTPLPPHGIIVFSGPSLGPPKPSPGTFLRKMEKENQPSLGMEQQESTSWGDGATLSPVWREQICSKNEAKREVETRDRGGMQPPGPQCNSPPRLMWAGDSAGPNPKPGDAALGSWAWHRGWGQGTHRSHACPFRLSGCQGPC